MSVAGDVQEIFDQMPRNFLPEKATGMNKTVQLELSGEGGGQWAINIVNGSLAVNKGRAEAPNLTLRMDARDYVDLVHGRANPMALFMAGKVKVDGDLSLALKFQEIFARP
jgi:putative sterol carrier protein